MIVNKVTDDISVAHQITVADIAELAAAGFKSIICNRPDGEDLGQTPCEEIRAAAEASGMSFRFQPVASGRMTPDDVAAFKSIYADVQKPVLAYCRTGTRCAFLWAFSHAGQLDTDEIIAATAKAGYDLSGMAAAIDRMAK